jgi:hypothetical protein
MGSAAAASSPGAQAQQDEKDGVDQLGMTVSSNPTTPETAVAGAQRIRFARTSSLTAGAAGGLSIAFERRVLQERGWMARSILPRRHL